MGTAASEFDYALPEAAIAQVPQEPRDQARLLVANGTNSESRRYEHKLVRDLPSLIADDTLLVVNDTRVLPARFKLFKTTGGAVEVLLLERQAVSSGSIWLALVKPGKRLREGMVLSHRRADDSEAGIPVIKILERRDDGSRLVELLDDGLLHKLGIVPLPPYIHEPLADPDRYQTVYADKPGSVAAPTAGLHLTNEVLDAMTAKGISIEKISLSVGLGTFRPITAELIDDHTMHSESYQIDPEVWARIRAAKRVLAVGTTTVRALESAAASGDLAGSTELFIQRGFEWQVVDQLMTNFHVPRSSLLVMIDAFVGPVWRDIYRTALDEGYRFLSFGDAQLLSR